MKNNKYLLAVLAGFVASFALGFIVYGALDPLMKANFGLPDLYDTIFKKPAEMNWPAMILSNLAGAFFIATVLVWGNFTSAAKGAGAAAILGLLITVAYDFGLYSYSNLYTLTGVFIDMVANLVFSAVLGAVTGWVLSKGVTTTAG